MANTNKKKESNLSKSDTSDEIIIELIKSIVIKSLEKSSFSRAVYSLEWKKKKFSNANQKKEKKKKK